MEEIWKPVEGFYGLYRNTYEVSNLGRVRKTKTKEVVNQYLNKYGYLRVGLSRGGYKKNVGVHCLVAEAFLGPKPEGFDVDHVDFDKTNNRADNLQYLSHRENMKKSHDKAVEQFSLDGELIKRYPSRVEAANAVGVVDTAIGHCLEGRHKTCKGYIWRYSAD